MVPVRCGFAAGFEKREACAGTETELPTFPCLQHPVSSRAEHFTIPLKPRVRDEPNDRRTVALTVHERPVLGSAASPECQLEAASGAIA